MSCWKRRYVEMAKHIAFWSKDPSTKTGAVIVRPDGTIASIGYNGFPRGLEDKQELLENREEKYKRVVHAEMNAILNSKEDLSGYTLYQWPGQSCCRCAVHVIQTGIKKVVCPRNHQYRDIHETDLAESFYREAGIDVEYI